MNTKRTLKALVLSDLHAGHQLGLTPPEFSRNFPKDSPGHKITEQSKQYWKWFSKYVKKLGPYTDLIINGDAVDGDGIRSGGVEQITTDRDVQTDIVAAIVDYVRVDRIHMTFGTPAHNGYQEDWERILAHKIDAAAIEDEVTLTLNGIAFNFKHHVGRSSVPWGRQTGVAREWFNNLLSSIAGYQNKADILIRSHVHYFSEVGGAYPQIWKAYTTPALMGYGPKYARKLSGGVDFGFLVFTVKPSGEWSCRKVMMLQKHPSLKIASYELT